MERSREFREELRGELPAWQVDGIVTPGAARALAVRYELESLSRTGAAARDRSGATAAVGGVAVACALAAALSPAGLHDGALLPVAALAASFAAAPLVFRADALAPFVGAIRGVGRAAFYAVAFAMSFVPVAEALRFRSAASPGLLAALPPFLLALGAVLFGLRRTGVDPHARGEAMLLVATVLAFAAGLFLETGTGTAVVANLALAFLAAGRIVRGLSWLARGPFWEGLLLATVLGASRVADITLQGWPRVTGAFLITAGAVSAGLFFERHRTHALRTAPLHPA